MLKFLKCRESRSFKTPRKPHARVLANVLTRNHAVRVVPYSEHYLYLNSVSPFEMGIHTVGTLSHHDIEPMFGQCDIIPYQDDFICLVPGRVAGSLHVHKDFISAEMAITGSFDDVIAGRCTKLSFMVPEDKAIFTHLRDNHPTVMARMGISIDAPDDPDAMDRAFWDNYCYNIGTNGDTTVCTDPIVYL